MTAEQVPATPTGAAPATATPVAPTEPAGDPPTSLSVEELNAQWQHRVSQNDKAHAAEMKALRDQLSAKERAEADARRAGEEARRAGMSEAERVAAERDALRQELEQERAQRVIDTRKAKYPHIAADLDDQAIAVMDEGRLAALDARLSGGTAEPPSLIDPNSAGRPAPSSTKIEEKTSEQLKADLRAQGDSFAKELGLG